MIVGQTFGSFQVLAKLGEGGMGEVYRARDTKLDRDVALKILPDAFAADPDRLARFQREAKTLASLNHPNIGGIHGLEESAGITAIVMELVEGEDLAQRIARGAIPLDEALPIAKQIAEALETAHEQGIVHRDLKPANIKVRPDGTVKVLDFGLAKALVPAGVSPSVSQSPTITTPAMTQAGVILGTAAYMSPEQAKGRAADKRSDIWAFGCVLYEMLTGRRAFAGDDISDTLAAVLRGEPDWRTLPGKTPASIRRMLRRCLEKDRKCRLSDAADARLDIEDALTTPAPDVTMSMSRERWQRSAMVAAATLVVSGAVAAGVVWLATRAAPPSVVRTTITTSGSTALALSAGDRDLAITPDGSRVVYRNSSQLMVRGLDQLAPTVLSGGFSGTGPRGVFISPDGQWVGFFASVATQDAANRNIVLKKVAITGGPPVTVYEGQRASASRGATWSEDGTIIFATLTQETGLQRVSAGGGEPTVLTKPDRQRGEGDHFWPEFLPGGKAVLFTITPASGGIENAQVAVLDLQTGTSKVLIRGGSHAHYIPTGHLVYGVAGTLHAVGFDLRRLEVVGTPVPVLEGVVTTDHGGADAAVATNGSLVYVPGGAGDRQTIVLVDRQGRASPLPGLPPGSYRDVRVSPDGARIAVGTDTDVWTYDVVRGTLSRLTVDPAFDRFTLGSVPSALWTSDGQRIIFSSKRAGYPELYWRPADGTGSPEPLLARGKEVVDLRAMGWSTDGKHLLFTEQPQSRPRAIWQMSINRPADAKLLVQGNYPAVSPDGRWIAYESAASGQPEIYVERYPDLGNRQQISTEGGRIPVWSRDGRELFFTGFLRQQMFVVAVQRGTTFAAGRPEVLFEYPMFLIAGTRAYDLGPDGRFVVIRSGQANVGGDTASNMILVQNWHEELKRLVPTK